MQAQARKCGHRFLNEVLRRYRRPVGFRCSPDSDQPSGPTVRYSTWPGEEYLRSMGSPLIAQVSTRRWTDGASSVRASAFTIYLDGILVAIPES